METLLEGDSVEVSIDEQLVFEQLDNDENAIWSLLLASGYLKVDSLEKRGLTLEPWYHLSITNLETVSMFSNMFRGWFNASVSNYNGFIRALLRGNVKEMNIYMNEVALSTFSSFDSGKHPSGKSEPERFYHGFVLGLLVELRDKYEVQSNRESGYGRYDVMIIPRDKNSQAVIIEFKVIDSQEETSLDMTADSALKQIEEKNYDAKLLERGYKREAIQHYGFAFEGKKVLITGNTGFKGSWLSAWLLMLGAEVYGYSNSIPTQPSMFEVVGLPDRIHHHYGDIRNKEEMSDYVQAVKPDFIFHLAAQAIVSTSYKEPFDTITTNVVGTASVLEAIRNITWNCTCVLITSDKAYDNVEWIWGYRETDAVGGKDVYSGSKGAAELTIKCYWKSFIQAMPNIKLGVARAGNVIGGGDWAKDRIIVDCVKAFSRNEVVEIRSPKATRPWQHVLEPLSGYLNLGQYLYEGKVKNGEPFNFGPRAEQTKTVFQLVQDLAELWGLDRNTAARLTGNVPFEEATLLKLNCDKALAYLDWHSTLHYEECVHFIADWYKAFYTDANVDMYSLTTAQIDSYVRAAGAQHLKWAE